MDVEQAEASEPLVCAECGWDSPPDARGWRAYLTTEDEPVMFCRECSEREFESDAKAD